MRDHIALRRAQILRPAAAERWQPRNWWDDDGGTPATRVVDGEERARVYIYEPIDSWGGSWGVAAKDVVPLIHSITAPAIDLHINTPGGEVWEAWAIMNALKAHSSPVTTHIDGVAASAGSVIMLAGDEIVAAEASQIYIHDAHSFAYGDEAALLVYAARLGQLSQQVAELYAKRGGTPDAWREAMRASGGEGTWYAPTEALAAGLVDRIDDGEASGADDTDSPAPGSDGVSNTIERFRGIKRANIVRARARQNPLLKGVS